MRLPVLLLLAAPLLAHARPGTSAQAPVPSPAPTAPAPAFSAQAFYLQSCAMCHGQDGTALRPDGKKTGAQNLTSAWWQKHTRNDEIVDAILNGRHSFRKRMPGFKGRISEADALKVATEVVRKLQKGAPVKVAAATETPAK